MSHPVGKMDPMHVRRMGKGWQVQVYAGRDHAGRKRYRYATRRTRDEARNAGDDLRKEIRRGTTLDDDCTLDELLGRWFDHARATRGWSGNNVTQTRYRLARIRQHPIVKTKVCKLRVRDLDAYYTELRTHGGIGGGPLSPSTVRRFHADLSSALNQAIVWEIITSNPAALASPGDSDPHEVEAPSDEDVQRVTEAAFALDPDLGAFLVTSAVVGGRRSELLALQWRDLEGGEVWIRRSLVYGPDGLDVKDWPKTKKSRRVSIDADTEWVLSAVRDRASMRAEACGHPLATTAFVFTYDPAGLRPWRPNTVTHQFIALRRKVGAPETLQLRDLRHYMASVLIAAGVDIETVSHREGHARTSTTLDIYTHLVKAKDTAAADVIGAKVHQRS